MDLRVEKLAEDMGLSKREMIDYIIKIDAQYGLGITGYYELSRYHYDIIRGSLDMEYMIRCLKRVKRPGVQKGTVRDHTKAVGYPELVSWLRDYNLDGYSTAGVRELLPETLQHCGVQTVAAALRELRYVSKVIKLDNSKQGRRWVRTISTKAFFL